MPKDRAQKQLERAKALKATHLSKDLPVPCVLPKGADDDVCPASQRPGMVIIGDATEVDFETLAIATGVDS